MGAGILECDVTFTKDQKLVCRHAQNDLHTTTNILVTQTIDQAIKREGDLFKVIDVLARDVGVLGIFSDWAAPVTYYANCMGLK
jgi:glycerophosphoryl diester phosphodiesterase